MALKARKARKKAYGGLSPRHVSLIRVYLRKLNTGPSQLNARDHPELMAAWEVWTQLMISNLADDDDDAGAKHFARIAGLRSGTVAALKAGIAVMRRRGVGALRRGGWSPTRSFGAIGITA